MKLTASMIIDYQEKAKNCKNIGEWKALGREIRDRHNLTDREAISILNGRQDEVLKIIANQDGETSNRCSWLKYGMTYYFPAPWKHSLVDSFMYDGGESDKRYISLGLVFRTKEEAIEGARKMLAALKEKTMTKADK